jgi:hypothetical protein
MAQPQPDVPGDPVVRDRLDELADVLEHTSHIDSEVRDRLLDLLDELDDELDANLLTPAAQADLSATLAEVSQALRQEKAAPIEKARGRLARAVARAEADAPVLTGFLERLLDTLSNIGI